MIYLKYNNLDDLYRRLNRLLLLEYDKYKDELILSDFPLNKEEALKKEFNI